MLSVSILAQFLHRNIFESLMHLIHGHGHDPALAPWIADPSSRVATRSYLSRGDAPAMPLGRDLFWSVLGAGSWCTIHMNSMLQLVYLLHLGPVMNHESGYFYGIIHPINGVWLVLISGKAGARTVSNTTVDGYEILHHQMACPLWISDRPCINCCSMSSIHSISGYDLRIFLQGGAP